MEGASEEVRSKSAVPQVREIVCLRGRAGEHGLRKPSWKQQEEYSSAVSSGPEQVPDEQR